MTVSVALPGRPESLAIDAGRWDRLGAPPPARGEERARLAFAAAHLVMTDAYAGAEEGVAPLDFIDWPGTMALRRRLDAHGFGIAEAMDTAQRFEIGWPTARRLIEDTGRLRLAHGFVAGAGTDHAPDVTRADLADAVTEQVSFIRAAGGVPVILPMPILAKAGCDADAYVRTYAAIAERAGGPLLVHWLGPMFLASLEGYFPADSFERVMALDPTIYRGAKLSLLDSELEIRHRRALLARDQIMLTGDDWNFAGLIEGSADVTSPTMTRIGPWTVPLGDFSHALLGIFDGIAVPAVLALDHLAAGNAAAFRAIMTACEAVGRVVFEPPTHAYKVGLAFLAWLDGVQANPLLPYRLDRARSTEHLVRVIEAAAAAGVFEHAETTAARLASWTGAVRS